MLPGVGQGVGYLLIIFKMTVKKNKQRKQLRTYPDSKAESKMGKNPWAVTVQKKVKLAARLLSQLQGAVSPQRPGVTASITICTVSVTVDKLPKTPEL